MPERHCDHQIQLPAIPFLATTPVTNKRRIGSERRRDHRRARQPPGNIPAGNEEFLRAAGGASAIVQADEKVHRQVGDDDDPIDCVECHSFLLRRNGCCSEIGPLLTRRTETRRLLNFARYVCGLAWPFHDGDVAIDGKIGETLRCASGHRPFHFEPVDFRAIAQAEHDARVVSGEIAAAADFDRGFASGRRPDR